MAKASKQPHVVSMSCSGSLLAFLFMFLCFNVHTFTRRIHSDKIYALWNIEGYVGKDWMLDVCAVAHCVSALCCRETTDSWFMSWTSISTVSSALWSWTSATHM